MAGKRFQQEGPAFAQRLNLLFRHWERTNGRHLTLRTVAEYPTKDQSRVSIHYLSQLRHGQRDNPSATVVRHLCGFFGVDEEYFDFGSTSPASDDSALATRLTDPTLRRLLRAASGLSAQSLETLVREADRQRRQQSLRTTSKHDSSEQ
ncbi:helix-turn-helix domain-containing protein [Nocardia inohanensis]|uniref:helix-turn-helix domain-containing protein n=1 Tax=Nocardia inohanensis TaxID=209246 RepID=UPI0008343B00|nr:helix-turn-helix domain-containing protein [Nocardia inohanensis]